MKLQRILQIALWAVTSLVAGVSVRWIYLNQRDAAITEAKHSTVVRLTNCDGSFLVGCDWESQPATVDYVDVIWITSLESLVVVAVLGALAYLVHAKWLERPKLHAA